MHRAAQQLTRGTDLGWAPAPVPVPVPDPVPKSSILGHTRLVKFQERDDLDSAEKYRLAAWQLRKDTTTGMHLGPTYESQGRKDEAIEFFSRASKRLPREMSAMTKKKRTSTSRRFSGKKLMGRRARANRRRNPKGNDTTKIANQDQKQGIAQFRIIVAPDSKVTDIALLSPDTTLSNLADVLRRSSMPQVFPDRASAPSLVFLRIRHALSFHIAARSSRVSPRGVVRRKCRSERTQSSASAAGL
jgi:hypothetical protein